MFLAAVAVGCSETPEYTEVSAVVASHFTGYEDLEPGDPIAGGELRIYVGDTVVLETVLDETGAVSIEPESGTYDLQVSLDSSDPGCFWGETLFDVSFPSTPILVEVAYICAGQ